MGSNLTGVICLWFLAQDPGKYRVYSANIHRCIWVKTKINILFIIYFKVEVNYKMLLSVQTCRNNKITHAWSWKVMNIWIAQYCVILFVFSQVFRNRNSLDVLVENVIIDASNLHFDLHGAASLQWKAEVLNLSILH